MNSSGIKLFSEEDLEILRKQNKRKQERTNQGSELYMPLEGGPKIIEDTSYLLSKEKREEIFQKSVMEAIPKEENPNKGGER